MLKKLILDIRHQFDLFGIQNGLFNPIKSFMNQQEALSVCHEMKFQNTFFPLPILLRLTNQQLQSIKDQSSILLCAQDQTTLAKLDIHEVFPWCIHKESFFSLGTNQVQHPYYQYLLNNQFTYAISGELHSTENQKIIPKEGIWKQLYRTPQECNQLWNDTGVSQIVGFQTRNPLHKSHMTLIEKAVESISDDGNKVALLHPVIGPTQTQDIDPFTRIRLYQMALPKFKNTNVVLNLLPINMRMAGPKEALWHSIIRKNVGCTHFIVGRDHAGPTPKRDDGTPFYGPYDAQKLALDKEKDLGIKILAMPEMVYDMKRKIYSGINEVPKKDAGSLSGTALRMAITESKPIPEWFTLPSIEKELRRVDKTKKKHQGLCLYAFGISGSGKTTTLLQWNHLLKEQGFQKPITILDGDEIRQTWSPDLGFSPEERKLHVRRIGALASMIVQHGGIVFVANIAPFEADRQFNKNLISQYGHYIDIFFDINMSECAKRDVKGFYKTEGLQKMNVFERPLQKPTFTIHKNDEHSTIFQQILQKLQSMFSSDFPDSFDN